MKLKKILSEKENGKHIYTIRSDATLKEAARKIVENNVGCLMVVDPKSPEKYVGIVAKSDIIKKIVTDDNFREIKVESIMTTKMIVATMEDEVEYIAKVMKRHKIHHIPVIEKTKVAGIISMADIIGSIHEEDELKISYLGDLMGGTYGSNVY